jgi:hypothetical protein
VAQKNGLLPKFLCVGTLELVHPVTSNQLDCLIANGLRTDYERITK